MTIVAIIILIIIAEYFIVFSAAGIAWVFNKKSKDSLEEENSFVSIIIAARNEKESISETIKSILKQSYQNYELIIVDDHSEDNTAEIVRTFTEKYSNIYLYSLPDNLYGKKNALRYAVSKSASQLLFFTDADCIINNLHLDKMLKFRKHYDTDMLCGPVEFLEQKTFLSKLFQLEFLSLTGSGAAGIFLKMPFICNGANYMILKDLFISSSEKMNDKYSSGDDVFMLQYLAKNHKVDFIKDRNCIVQTKAPAGISDFISQRLRWASKSKAYKSLPSVYVAALVFVVSLIVLLTPILLFANNENATLYIYIALGLKFIAELLFIIPVLQFHKKLYLVLFTPFLFVLHPLYIICVAIFSLFYRPLWKGRRIEA